MEQNINNNNSSNNAGAALAGNRPINKAYLKIEAFPSEIQERILTLLSPVDRVRIELISKIWRGMVRKNGWALDLELDSECLRNFDRLQRVGFGQITRRLVCRIDQKESSSQRSQSIKLMFSFANAFPNLVQLRIENIYLLRDKTLFKQLAQLTNLKTLSLTRFHGTAAEDTMKFGPQSLEFLVLDELHHSTAFPVLTHSLKSIWLDVYANDTLEVSSFNELFNGSGVRHLGLGKLHFTQLAVQPIRQLKESLLHLSFKMPLCYHSAVLPTSCRHSQPLNFDGLAQMFSDLSALVSLEIGCIGPNELTLVFKNCRRLDHFAFTFVSNNAVTDLNVASLMLALEGLPTSLPHLRSLDFLLSNATKKEPMKSTVDELLVPTMRRLADIGRIEYLSVTLVDWDEELNGEIKMNLPDDLALQFVRCCNNLRFLDHRFQDPNSGNQLRQILDEKMRKNERSLIAPRGLINDKLLMLPKGQNPPFEHLLVAFCPRKQRNHVFCAIRTQSLTATPPDFFFTKSLETRQNFYIKIKIVDQPNEMHFRIKHCAYFGRLKRTYAERRGFLAHSFHLQFNERTLEFDDSPESLGMTEDEVTLVQVNLRGFYRNRIAL